MKLRRRLLFGEEGGVAAKPSKAAHLGVGA
jgi:hypothetical protein